MIHYLTLQYSAADPQTWPGKIADTGDWFDGFHYGAGPELPESAIELPSLRDVIAARYLATYNNPNGRASADDAHRAIVNVAPDSTTTADQLDELIQSGADHYDIADTYLGRRRTTGDCAI
jgi:hypothetical protein